ncbi:histone deacetylase family protein [Nocardioides sp. GY 10127]|uniref:histone deacetylase family protein n=1 Tax=Nocardioides sp. GY 10127 TaxID=2569762 RepID=UPI001457F04F|nr:histone deacetylase family protein [Nocardioides sp. GY 10127]
MSTQEQAVERFGVVWSPDTRLHDPRHEVWVGTPTPAVEVPERVDVLLEALTGDSGGDSGSAGPGPRALVEATSHDDRVLRRVHEPGLLLALRDLERRWAAGPYAALVGQDRAVPYFFATPALLAGMPPTPARALHAQVGERCYDTMTLVGPGTWAAVRAAVDCALTAVDLVAAGARGAYALCRPPGHHATPGGYGGSCYLNNAAVAAEALLDAGCHTVSVIDIDAHHGNGTQAAFWRRGDVRYGSVHVDPAAGWFPHVFGHESEVGEGSGTGATLNRPVPEGTEDGRWLAEIVRLAAFAEGADALVVSLGLDAAVDDPEAPLAITHDGYRLAGEILGGLGIPTVVVQEGGYHLPSLGSLVRAYLEGHEGA